MEGFSGLSPRNLASSATAWAVFFAMEALAWLIENENRSSPEEKATGEERLR